MSRLSPLIGLVVALCATPLGAQVIHTYTNNETGPERIALGYPVPRAVASLTPVEGFRDYASLDARLRLLEMESADLAGHDVGQSFAGRPIRAYVASSAGGDDVEGRPKAAFFINAVTHAREWGTPEVSTYLVERMVEGAGDQGLVRYLLDNTRLVIIPVHNVDGLLQTQRYPDRVIIGQDPRVPNAWPRDGRMRRKNMRGVDENLETFADHLGGIDLNRNHPPFWGTTTQGNTLNNPNELVFRGSGPHSEPESQALLAAAELGPPSRYRLGVDVHTFSRVFFSSNTGRSRLNAIQTRLLSVVSGHHVNVPTAEGAPNGRLYRDVPDPPNSGIGAAAEFFAYEWLVPAWTLELEPQNSGAEYGGTGANHSGFILPESQVRRVREAWAESFLVSFYFMAGPPHLRAVRVLDAATGAPLQEQRWQRDPASGQRSLQRTLHAPLAAGRAVRVELVFNKPMRYRDASGQVASLPGLNSALQPVVRRLDASGNAIEALDVSAGEWLGSAGFQRYRDDTFRFPLVLDGSGELRFEVITQDMVGLALDADPATPVDWQDGAWSRWEDATGTPGDLGGPDRQTASLLLEAAGSPSSVSLLQPAANVVGEGDRLRLRLSRSAADAAGAVQLSGRLAGSPEASVSWADGESGERLLALPVEDNLDVDGARVRGWEVHVGGTTDGPPLFAGSVRVYDNDRAGHAVLRSADDPRAALQLLAQSPAAQRDLVLDGGRSYVGPSNPLTACQQFDMRAPLRVYGNRATLKPGESSCTLVTLQGEGVVELHDLQLDGSRGGVAARPLIQAGGQSLRLRRVVARNALGYLVDGVAELDIRQSALLDSAVSAAGREGNFAAVDVDSIRLGEVSAFAISSALAAGDTSIPALIQSASAAESPLDALSYDSLPGWLFRGSFTIRSSVYLDQGGVGITPPPRCNGVRSLGFNVFSRRLFQCFDFIESDRNLAVGVPMRAGPDLAWRLPPDELVDSGGDCGAIDQRGAPRPQTMVPGATPRCDIGAVERGVNPWRGFWQPTRDGHGIDLQTAGNVLTLLWYTYAEDGQPTAYLAAAPLTGPRWEAELLTAVRNPDNGSISNPAVGTIRLDFDSDIEATLGWQFHGRAAGSERVTALDFAGSEPRVEVTGSWFPPAESGNGASIARRGEVTAMALYYYDAAGVLRWALGQGSGDDVIRVPLESFTGFCPDCDAASNPVNSVPAGEAILHFRTPQQMSAESDLTYPGSNGGRWTRASADFVPLNDPVDNREAAASARR